MKLNRLETHDRLEHFLKQSFEISDCCQDIVNKRPFGNHPFYIYAHARTIPEDERFKLYVSGAYQTYDQVPLKSIVWQPRLTKPKADTNSMLFKAYPGTDNIKIIWMIPEEGQWYLFKKGMMTEDNTIYDSIQAYKYDRSLLEAPENDDLPDWQIDNIYREVAMNAKQAPSGASSILPESPPSSP